MNVFFFVILFVSFFFGQTIHFKLDFFLGQQLGLLSMHHLVCQLTLSAQKVGLAFPFHFAGPELIFPLPPKSLSLSVLE